MIDKNGNVYASHVSDQLGRYYCIGMQPRKRKDGISRFLAKHPTPTLALLHLLNPDARDWQGLSSFERGFLKAVTQSW